MGGKAFSILGIDAVRLPTELMLPIGEAAVRATGGAFVPWIRDKPDHGDADVVIPASAAAIGDAALTAAIARETGFTAIHRRPHVSDVVMAVGVESPHGWFQIDLISAPDELADFSRRFLAWGDIGTIMGQTARQMGLLFGQDGLRLPLRVPNAPRDSLLLTADFGDAIDFLGWDDAAHKAGFDNLDQAATFIASGRMFDPTILLPERMSGKARSKARRRSGRPAFVADLMSRPAAHCWPVERDLAAMARSQEHAVERFSAHTARANMLKHLAKIATGPGKAFSGATLAQLSGLTGDDLPLLANAVRHSFPDIEMFHAWRDSASPQQVEEKVKEVMRGWSNAAEGTTR